MIEIHCLGPPRVLVDGEDPPPELMWRKHLALLVYLALSPRGRSRDHLVGLLWSEKEDSKARHSLNEALRVIRRSAGDGLVTEGDVVRLDPSVFVCDVDDANAVRGQFLEGFSVADAPGFEDWMGGERQKVRVRSLEALVTSAQELTDSGDLSAGREEAQRALDVEPLHEPAVRVLMRAHALEGARALALQVFERFSTALASELRLEPDTETRALAARIASEQIVRGAPAVAGAQREMVPIVGPGRRSLAACLAVWRATRSGRPGIIVLRGEAGSGKTRVGDELVARARLDGAVAAQVRVLETDTPDGVWSALLRGGLAVPELGGAAPQVLAALSRYDPNITVRFPAAKEHDPDASGEVPFAGAVFAIAESKPVLLVFDDAGHAEADLIETAGAIVQRAGEARVCVLLAASSGPGAAAVDSLSQRVGRDLNGQIVRTGVFEDEDVDELVRWAFPEYDAEAVERLRRRVMAETGGIPFLAVEFVRAVRAGLSVREDEEDRIWPDKHRTLDQTIPGELPEVVTAALRTRFRDLTNDAQELLRVVAVVGGGEPVKTLAGAADVSQKRAETALDELEWERWLAGDAHGYKFVTGLAGAIVLSEMVTAGQRRRILKRAGKD